MNHALSGARNLGMAGSGSMEGGANAARQVTLAERLERANNVIDTQMVRVLIFIERVNGTPRPPGSASPHKIATTTPLAASVENTEALGKRLCELVDGLERIS